MSEVTQARDRIKDDAAEARGVIKDDAAAAREVVVLDMTTVTVRLQGILNGFKHEQNQREKRRRTVVGSIAVAVAAILISLTVAVSAVHTQTVQSAYDSKAAAHAACLSRSEGRDGIKQALGRVLDDLADTVPPEQRPTWETFAKVEKANLAKDLPAIDCDKEAPAPSGSRPEWPY